MEYHAPFVFPFLKPEEGGSTGPPLRFVAGYNNTEQSGIAPGLYWREACYLILEYCALSVVVGIQAPWEVLG